MGFGLLICFTLCLIGVLGQTICPVPCSRPNGFNPNLLNPVVICPSEEQNNDFNAKLIKRVLGDLKHLTRQTKDILATRLQASDLSGVAGVQLPNAINVPGINNLTVLRSTLHENLLIFNVFVERVQWSQRCLFLLEGQVNTIASHLNLLRSSLLTLACSTWDGHQKAADNINISYSDRQTKYIENKLAFFSMKALHHYAHVAIQKINALTS